jgi:uncharacterized protein
LSEKEMSENLVSGTSIDMIIERDVAIPMDDGINLRADIFRPRTKAKVPVIMTLGPYGKGLRYQTAHQPFWKQLIDKHPEVLQQSTGSYLVIERVDPEIWIPYGYAVIHVDSRGASRSPGILDPYSPRENHDYYLCVEWAGKQNWCNGKVGLCGVSYYAINQWLVASLQPPHLGAIIPWEGAADHYRDWSHHGGILSNVFIYTWYFSAITGRQHGTGPSGPHDDWLNEPSTGQEAKSSADLLASRSDYYCSVKAHELDDEFHRERSAVWSKIKVPFLSAANWGGLALHERGNFEAFMSAASKNKWLQVHGGDHDEEFRLPSGVALEKRFFDYFLKGEKNGWDKESRVLLNIRYADQHFELRGENEWPLARTRWTKAYLDANNVALNLTRPAKMKMVKFEAIGDGVTFTMPPLEKETEITGPLAAKLFLSSSTTDADIFLTLIALDQDGNEITFLGASEPHVPLAQGWLRASHRHLDKIRSKPYRPYHTHDRIQPLKPGSVYQLEIEIWPTCIVLPPGHRIALVVQGKDYEREASETLHRGQFKLVVSGSGHFLHNNPDDRPGSVFGGKTTIYTGGNKTSYLLLPIISH